MPTQEEVVRVLEKLGCYIAITFLHVPIGMHIPIELYEDLNPHNVTFSWYDRPEGMIKELIITYNHPNNRDFYVQHRRTLTRQQPITELALGQAYRVPENRIIPIGLRPEAEFRPPSLHPNSFLHGLTPEWWGVDKVQETEPHPPYPLIGLEYEPQLTLLNYPKKRVHIGPGSEMKLVDYTPDAVGLYLPFKYEDNIDQDNLEFRTPPVKFEDLPAEIAKLQTEMETLVMEIAKAVGPVGLFLPAAPCSKHVNLSGFPDCGFPRKDIELKPCKYGLRQHIKVPYDFTDYNYIATNPVKYFTQTKPILLGYSMTGDSFVRRCELP